MKSTFAINTFFLLTATSSFIVHSTNATCDVCPDGSNVTKSDTVIPFFQLTSSTPAVTCGFLEFFVRSGTVSLDPAAGDCDAFHDQAGFCGCAGFEPMNDCHLCNDPADVMATPDKISPAGVACADIDEYLSFFSADECSSSDQINAIKGYAYSCGCPGVEPECSMCAEGTELSDPNQLVPGDISCQTSADIISAFTEESCEERQASVLVNGVRCGCRGVEELPGCAITQNLGLCTTEMLDAVEEDCECYSFCAGRFTGCETFPGRIITTATCVAGDIISGCNYANAGTSGAGASLLSAALLWSSAVAMVLFIATL